MNKFTVFLTKNYTPVFVVYVLLSLVAPIQGILLGMHMSPDGVLITNYNNFMIFKQSFYHLIENKDLYIRYPEEHWDLYKYSPSFALLFAPLAVLPEYLGVILWDVLNAMVLFLAIIKLPYITEKHKISMLFILTVETMTSMQNEQSNALIAGLLIFAFIFMEKRNYLIATLFIVLTVYIKLFGIVAFSLFLLYPKRMKFIVYSAFWMILFAFLPLIIVSPEQLKILYQSWGHTLANDHSASLGLSVLGWLHSWFGFAANKNILLLIGMIIFMLPFVIIKNYKDYPFRLMILASVLIWVVIFNHKAESPTFVLAMSGVAIWFFAQKRKMGDKVLLVLAIVFTSLSVTDIFPPFIRFGFFRAYDVKVIPCILIWGKLIYDLMIYKPLASIETGT
jgi:hypothetical protein